MKEKEARFLLVHEDILPEAIRKTALVKELLTRGKVETVGEGVEQVGLSRSAFYKYKDGVFPFYSAAREKLITITLLLDHRPGILSHVLNTIAEIKGNVLTINQSLPQHGVANVSLSIETMGMEESVDHLIKILARMDGVDKVEIIGQN